MVGWGLKSKWRSTCHNTDEVSTRSLHLLRLLAQEMIMGWLTRLESSFRLKCLPSSCLYLDSELYFPVSLCHQQHPVLASLHFQVVMCFLQQLLDACSNRCYCSHSRPLCLELFFHHCLSAVERRSSSRLDGRVERWRPGGWRYLSD